ncbi:MAG: sugar phosphate nucleotidyltransferase [Bauldia sp.]
MTQHVRPAPLARDALAYVLAGGRGSRLMELTDKRAKPAVFFGGKTRIIDFALSNAVNSGIRRIAVATQYRAHSLIRHLQRGWNFLRPGTQRELRHPAGEPAAQRKPLVRGHRRLPSTRTSTIVRSYRPEHIVVLAGDHIYKMDYELMLQQHVNSGADVTVGCLEVPRMEATGFGVMHVDADDRIVTFLEKPKDPPGIPGNPEMALASMGIYVFQTDFLFEQLERDANDPSSSRDFGKDLIPYIVKHGKAVAHRFTQSCVRSAHEPQAYLARRRHGGCLLGGEHRPHRHRPGARPVRSLVADLDECRTDRAGKIRPRRGRAARHGGVVGGSPAAASYRARR